MKMFNPGLAEPGYAMPLQTVKLQISGLLKKTTDLDLHCLPFSMRFFINNLIGILVYSASQGLDYKDKCGKEL